MTSLNGRSACAALVLATLGLGGCMGAAETQLDPAQSVPAAISSAERSVAPGQLQTRIVGRIGRNRQPTSASYGAWRTQYKAAPIRGPVAVTGHIISAPAVSELQPGKTYKLALSGRGFASASEGGGLDLSFDPRVVEVTDVTVDGSTWEFFTRGGAIDNIAGSVKNIAFASFAGRKGDFAIASVSFRARTDGDSRLKVTESPINPFGSRGQRILVEIETPRLGGAHQLDGEPNLLGGPGKG